MAWHLLPWSWAVLGLVVPSGLLMFTAHATEMAANPAFRLKLILLGVAGVNAVFFERRTFRSVAAWDRDTPAPAAARVAAVISLLAWAGVLLRPAARLPLRTGLPELLARPA